MVSGCLENLNQQKYFDKLKAASPVLAQRVETHRESIERQLRADLEAKSPAPVTHIGLWGESQDFVRRVSDGEQLFMRGRIFHPEGGASRYYLSFTIADDGTVEISDGRVFANNRGPL